MRDKTENVKRKGQSWGKQEDGVQARQRCWPWRGVEGLEGKVREVEGTLAWWALLGFFFFLMWTILKVFIEFVTILLLFYVLFLWP